MCVGILCKLIAFVLTGLGIAAIIIGAVLGFAVLPNDINSEVERRVRLEESTPQFERWKNLAFNQQMKIYFFEIDNNRDIESGTAVPSVAEKGPYVYDLTRRKDVLGIDTENDRITYKEELQFTFNSSETSGSEDDEVLMLNTPLMSILQHLETLQPIPNVNNEITAAFPTTEGLFQQFSVRDILFDGFRFCAPPNQALQICNNVVSNNYFQRETDDSITFAFKRRRNHTDDGTYVIAAGMDRIQDLGLISSWNESNTLPDPIWGTTGNCRLIRGRDSTIFPPDVQRRTDFDIFFSNLCRVVTLEHIENQDFEDIPSQRREFLKSTLSNNGSNSCFCSGQTKLLNGSSECWPNGFMDLQSCTGAPIILSYPHFLDAEEYLNTVTGLEPNADRHRSYTILEPGTGTALRIVKRFQYNMVLRPISNVAITERMPQALVPLFWIEETMDLPSDLMDKIRDEYLERWHTVTIVTWVLIGGGIAMFLASILLKILCC